MPTTYNLDIVSFLITAVSILAGLVWRALHLRINNLEDKQRSMPFHVLEEDIAVIKRDIEWIKNLFKNRTA